MTALLRAVAISVPSISALAMAFPTTEASAVSEVRDRRRDVEHGTVLALDGEPSQIAEESERGRVLNQDRRREMGDAAPAGQVGKLTQQARSDAPALVSIRYLGG